jgi:tripartite-type tricarboxylate transporter receptor subunit TctC
MGFRTSIALALTASVAATTAASAAEDFYKGKQIKIIVSSAPGGSYDAMARLLAVYMPKYIPGTPTMIVENMPGGGGLTAVQYMLNVAPKDGTVINATQANIPTAPLLQSDVAKFDPNTFGWIGNITKDPYVGFMWHTSPAQSLEDMKTKESSVAGSASGGISVDSAIMAKEMFGYKLKIVSGYPDSSATKLAIERGEVDGIMANGWADLKLQKREWLTDKKIKVFVQLGLTKLPDLPDVPLFIDQAKNEEDREALLILLGRQEFTRPYYVPPGTAPDRLETLRTAFEATMKDAKFVDEIFKKSQVEITGSSNGKELAALVSKISNSPPAAAKRLEKAFTDFKSGK